MKICVSISAENPKAALAAMKKASVKADLIELRIDRFGGQDLESLLRAKTRPIIVTNRKKDEGGFYEGSEARRIAELERAVSLGADIVDIEMSSCRRGIAALTRRIEAQEGGSKLLISYHDFKETPSDQVLRDKLAECAGAGADIIKIITYANRMEDNFRVLSLIREGKERGCRVVAFCMGDTGRVSRAAAPLFGAPFTYAALRRGAESAPGQMTVAELKSIFRGR